MGQVLAIVVAVLLFWGLIAAKGGMRAPMVCMRAPMVCMVCETVDSVKTATKGSFGIEVVLWLFFIVPGLIYSLWRMSTRHKVCAACGSDALVPLKSPVGRRITGAGS